MAVQVTRPAPKRRASPPRQPKIRKQGFRPFRDRAFARIALIRGETFTQQYYACLVLALFIGLSAILAIRAVYEVDMAVGQYRTGGDILAFCIAGPPHLELTGRCNSVNCLEAKASLIYDTRGLQDIYDNNCTVPAEAPRS